MTNVSPQEKAEVSLIAVRFDPNVDLIVSLLAILKAGFSYLPIAPDWPEERIHYLLEDAKPLAILTNKVDYDSTNIKVLQYGQLNTRQHSDGDLDSDEMYPGNVSDTYAIMYTSGSSGLPKGKQYSGSFIVLLQTN